MIVGVLLLGLTSVPELPGKGQEFGTKLIKVEKLNMTVTVWRILPFLLAPLCIISLAWFLLPSIMSCTRE